LRFCKASPRRRRRASCKQQERNRSTRSRQCSLANHGSGIGGTSPVDNRKKARAARVAYSSILAAKSSGSAERNTLRIRKASGFLISPAGRLYFHSQH
jgi:hypothetical protein